MKKLDVVNFALGMLGHRAVKGMDDEEVGDVVSAMWPIAVEFVVQEVKPVWSKRVERLHGEEDLRMPGFRMSAVSLELKPDGGYTLYEYDDQGRVILQATPWAGGGEKGTRTVYADLRFNDFRPATQIEIIIAPDGTETEIHKRAYTYEDSPQIIRTTVRETAIGSDQIYTTMEEIYGEMVEYPYARGRQKLTQGIDGVQTVYTYESATDYGAIHKIISTTQANGSIIPGQSWEGLLDSFMTGSAATVSSWAHALFGIHLLTMTITEPWLERIRKV